jgi:predicted dithiol-disulfide oxidoreductase (DUF899 family)
MASREEWLAARLALLEQENELTKRSDELARQRAALPWVPVEKDYTFATEAGQATLADLFAGRSQLIVYHFMLGPDWTEGCLSCSAIADGFEGVRVHLENHDVSLVAISRSPMDRLLAYRARMGWTFPWASSPGSDFNYDFHVTIDPDVAPVEYNYRNQAELEARDVSWKDWIGEQPSMSAFALDGGQVFRTYSAYARGFDALWGAYPWLDRAPLGRNEDGYPNVR